MSVVMSLLSVNPCGGAVPCKAVESWPLGALVKGNLQVHLRSRDGAYIDIFLILSSFKGISACPLGALPPVLP